MCSKRNKYLFWNQLYTLNPGGQMMEIKVQVNAS